MPIQINATDSDKSAKAIQGRKIAFLPNSAGETGHLQAKQTNKQSLTLNLIPYTKFNEIASQT